MQPYHYQMLFLSIILTHKNKSYIQNQILREEQ